MPPHAEAVTLAEFMAEMVELAEMERLAQEPGPLPF